MKLAGLRTLRVQTATRHVNTRTVQSVPLCAVALLKNEFRFVPQDFVSYLFLQISNEKFRRQMRGKSKYYLSHFDQILLLKPPVHVNNRNISILNVYLTENRPHLLLNNCWLMLLREIIAVNLRTILTS